MVDDEVKVGSEVLGTHECAEQNCCNSSGSGSSQSMSNAEIEKVDSNTKQSPVGGSGKRKALKSEGTLFRKRSELGKKILDEQCKDIGIKRSPVQMKKTRLVSSQSGGNEINLRKVKSDSANGTKCELRRKMKSEPRKNVEDPYDGNFKNSLQLVKAETLTPPRKITIDEHMNKSDDSDKDLGRIEECKDLKAITSNEDQIQSITSKNLEIKDIGINEEDQKPSNERSAPKKQIPCANHHNIHPKKVSDNSHGTQSKIQSLADLIMWKDVSRSTFVFGIGSFAIISTSYTNGLNISLISVLSYLGLIYLGVSFIFKSIIRRGNMDMDDSINQEYVVGEEEAVWLVKLFLPCVNELLLKLRGLFSGDPPTTIKLAVLLFIIAKCGGSITIWKMTKLGFFGVFIVPKLCSSYSSHLAAYGSFWIRRFGDAWESCSHKRAVGLGILTLVWNQSSVVGRIWGVFILFVAFKYYHHHRNYSGIKEEASSTTTSNSQCT
ncbi:hypothetical protein ACS0TY_024282 [Phlomoides rotata]